MEVVIYFCAHMTVLETTRWKEGGAFHHIIQAHMYSHVCVSLWLATIVGYF
jgi:hypothetical protein